MVAVRLKLQDPLCKILDIHNFGMIAHPNGGVGRITTHPFWRNIPHKTIRIKFQVGKQIDILPRHNTIYNIEKIGMQRRLTPLEADRKVWPWDHPLKS